MEMEACLPSDEKTMDLCGWDEDVIQSFMQSQAMCAQVPSKEMCSAVATCMWNTHGESCELNLNAFESSCSGDAADFQALMSLFSKCLMYSGGEDQCEDVAECDFYELSQDHSDISTATAVTAEMCMPDEDINEKYCHFTEETVNAIAVTQSGCSTIPYQAPCDEQTQGTCAWANGRCDANPVVFQMFCSPPSSFNSWLAVFKKCVVITDDEECDDTQDCEYMGTDGDDSSDNDSTDDTEPSSSGPDHPECGHMASCGTTPATCYEAAWRCDGDHDCPNGADEAGCVACDEDEFACMDQHSHTVKVCLPLEYVCDGLFDCEDRSDEAECEAVECEHDEFRCLEFAECVSHELVCDGLFDCADRTDEMNCEQSSCKHNEFMCADKLMCIDENFVCDGVQDCRDNSDEMQAECVESCDDGFQCGSGQCVSASSRCNRRAECNDASDEAGCGECKDHEAACASGDIPCVHTEWMCDGFADCEDGSDEGASCCVETENIASHLCGVQVNETVSSQDLTALCDNKDECEAALMDWLACSQSVDSKSPHVVSAQNWLSRLQWCDADDTCESIGQDFDKWIASAEGAACYEASYSSNFTVFCTGTCATKISAYLDDLAYNGCQDWEYYQQRALYFESSCSKLNDVYCMPKYLQAQAYVSDLYDQTLTVMNKRLATICDPCVQTVGSIKAKYSGDLSEALELQSMCTVCNGTGECRGYYCYPEVITSEQQYAKMPKELYAARCRNQCYSKWLAHELQNPLLSSEQRQQYEARLMYTCVYEWDPLNDGSEGSGTGLGSGSGSGSGSGDSDDDEDDDTFKYCNAYSLYSGPVCDGDECTAECDSKLAAQAESLGCCVGIILDTLSMTDPKSATVPLYAELEDTCELNIDHCNIYAVAVTQTHHVAGVSYSWYTDNKDAFESGFKTDLSLALGVLSSAIHIDKVSAGSAPAAASVAASPKSSSDSLDVEFTYYAPNPQVANQVSSTYTSESARGSITLYSVSHLQATESVDQAELSAESDSESDDEDESSSNTAVIIGVVVGVVGGIAFITLIVFLVKRKQSSPIDKTRLMKEVPMV
eukprot:TRINITY_DN1651_c0_g1::TRINITY_DN1651_c0_g1_i1::g.17621::m.17621 TRINITY_DN1651_c0_g1::TRINITY_DN1651_c0_g1_i1::g.17621  ORF type:complete len:1209 (-),score=453.40,sp/Q98931/LRP8_CHICK/29.69/9e-35,sp/Q98931/LRP8_CHICK/37.45/7e-28,sp/Q98931/LRP8_CHICK/36.55/1e-26,sp/Q98931/LRP8_CHICK/35.27/7e-20,sp/Q98931/LRP8_CHICK/34.17/8e-07,Ldl_recept_a/PF00057.13/1.5e+04,Ldl_recept_a/PF00057.13/9.3e+03,Ldl_recept_a/PF00057.13/1.5e+04,Ldl_recept_a/PF00057.13/5.5e+02,Ldl_recept_a/PF00057.13/0.0002,Ldl_recept_a